MDFPLPDNDEFRGESWSCGPNRMLLGAILMRAYEDLTARSCKPADRRSAIEWFETKDEWYQFIVETLELTSFVIDRIMLEVEKGKKLLEVVPSGELKAERETSGARPSPLDERARMPVSA